MGNLFSSFDPSSMIIFIDFPFNWVSTLIILVILPQSYWLANSQYSTALKNIFVFIKEELRAVFGAFVLPGTIFIFISLLIFILFSNFLGLLPYIFTSTSHFSMTLSLSPPLGIGRVILSILYQYNNLLAHLAPRGTPSFCTGYSYCWNGKKYYLTYDLSYSSGCICSDRSFAINTTRVSRTSFRYIVFGPIICRPYFTPPIRGRCCMCSVLRFRHFKVFISRELISAEFNKKY